MKNNARAVLWWAGEMLLGLLFQFGPALIALLSPDGAEGGLLVYALLLYLAQPAAALALPALMCFKKGVNPYAAFFPIGLCLLLSPAYVNAQAVALVCLFLGLVSACVGAEMKKRMEKKKNR